MPSYWVCIELSPILIVVLHGYLNQDIETLTEMTLSGQSLSSPRLKLVSAELEVIFPKKARSTHYSTFLCR